MTIIDLSNLPAPEIIETLSFEKIFNDIQKQYIADFPKFSANLESEPITALLEVIAYREMNLRTRINDAVKALMLPYSKKTDLDILVSDFNIKRIKISNEDLSASPPKPAIYENDENLRRRRQLGPESLTTAGSHGSYKFHALSAGNRVKKFTINSDIKNQITITYFFDENPTGALIKDASISSPRPGVVKIAILSHIEKDPKDVNFSLNGAPKTAIINLVKKNLTNKYVVPLTDKIEIIPAEIIDYAITAKIHLYNGPDQEIVKAAAIKSFDIFTKSRHQLGEIITQSGIHKSLHITGVKFVELINFTEIPARINRAPFCTGLNLTVVS